MPATIDGGDAQSAELGMKFEAMSTGVITGVRFYKGGANTGTDLADLWTANGTLLATATFTNETASGWQQVNFSTPVVVQANTEYVVSYYRPMDIIRPIEATLRPSGSPPAPWKRCRTE